MSSVQRGAVIDSIQRLFDRGTLLALGERQLLERFVSQGDESAFEAIVGRHGPMVLNVCRNVLDDLHDVEDAFQATFLVLVKKAGSIRDRDMLGTWLYGVARRVAVRARACSRRRQSHERNGCEPIEVPDDRGDLLEVNEIRALVDHELECLPYRFRAALVLCDLEGQTHEQAAAQLRCPVGTIKCRLSRGRERLRSRLARRGLATPLLLPGPALATDPAWAMPVELVSHTIKAATGLATNGTATIASITAQTALLTEGVIRTMGFTGLKTGVTLLLATTLVAGGVWLTAGLRPSQRVSVEQNRTAPADDAAGSGGMLKTSRPPANPEPERRPADPPPKRGALRIARLRHAGDWDVAPQAIPNIMASLSKPPFNFDVMIDPKNLFARDPNLIYCPLLYIQGREAFSFSEEDLDALRRHLDPGGGTLFGDANLGSPAFDAAFRRSVTKLFPTKTLVTIPEDDEIYSAKVGFDLSNVEFTKAAGGGRGFPQLEGVKINDHWCIIYSKCDISSALQGKNEINTKGYTPQSARKIACNLVIYSTLP